jgi:Fe-S-cluster-containing dehydrogenase component
MIIDVAKCEDCNNCLLSCKDEHVENEWPGYACAQPRHGHRWVNIMRKERGTFPMIDVAYRPTPCMHCDSAPCIEKALNHAVYKRNDGIVIIDPEKASGQKDLVKACPYNAIWWNEALNLPQKCTFCAHLIDDGWTKPRCVQSCPTGALEVRFVEEAEMNQIVAAEQLEVLHPELKTRPRVYYRNLYRFSHCFIGGSVATNYDGVVDCAMGASVTLYQGQEKLAETTTDNYGDFKFDRLAKSTGDYSVVIDLAGWGQQKVQVPTLKTSVNLGTISFSTAAIPAAETGNSYGVATY